MLSCQKERLVPATNAYRKDLKEKISKLKAGGTSELEYVKPSMLWQTVNMVFCFISPFFVFLHKQLAFICKCSSSDCSKKCMSLCLVNLNMLYINNCSFILTSHEI